jgi:hypothetical protein
MKKESGIKGSLLFSFWILHGVSGVEPVETTVAEDVAAWLETAYEVTDNHEDYVTADNLREQYNATIPRIQDRLSRKQFKDAMVLAGLKSEKASRGPSKNMMTYYGLKPRDFGLL